MYADRANNYDSYYSGDLVDEQIVGCTVCTSTVKP